jgi:hypothetical protein
MRRTFASSRTRSPGPRAALAWILLWPLVVHAAEPVDTVRLDDGSVVRGEILRLNQDDELVVDTEFSDDVAIEVEQRCSVDSSRPPYGCANPRSES